MASRRRIIAGAISVVVLGVVAAFVLHEKSVRASAYLLSVYNLDIKNYAHEDGVYPTVRQLEVAASIADELIERGTADRETICRLLGFWSDAIEDPPQDIEHWEESVQTVLRIAKKMERGTGINEVMVKGLYYGHIKRLTVAAGKQLTEKELNQATDIAFAVYARGNVPEQFITPTISQFSGFLDDPTITIEQWEELVRIVVRVRQLVDSGQVTEEQIMEYAREMNGNE